MSPDMRSAPGQMR